MKADELVNFEKFLKNFGKFLSFFFVRISFFLFTKMADKIQEFFEKNGRY